MGQLIQELEKLAHHPMTDYDTERFRDANEHLDKFREILVDMHPYIFGTINQKINVPRCVYCGKGGDLRAFTQYTGRGFAQKPTNNELRFCEPHYDHVNEMILHALQCCELTGTWKSYLV